MISPRAVEAVDESSSRKEFGDEIVSPVILLCGFLGSGKTTLLIRLLRRFIDAGEIPSVLMNEFGEIDIDGRLIENVGPRARDIELEKVLGGCLCCDARDGLEKSLLTLVERARGRPVVVETTGLAVAGAVADTAARALREIEPGRPRGEVRGVIGVVDAPNYGELKKIWPAAPAHLLAATEIVVNKMDLLPPEREKEVMEAVRRDFPQARLWPATRAEVDLESLLSENAPSHETPSRDTSDSTKGYRSAGFRVLAPLDLVRLQNLLDRHRKSVVRAKGFLRLHRFTGMHEVQWSGGLLTHTPVRGSRRAEFVVIGRRVPWPGFLQGLNACGRPIRR